MLVFLYSDKLFTPSTLVDCMPKDAGAGVGGAGAGSDELLAQPKKTRQIMDWIIIICKLFM